MYGRFAGPKKTNRNDEVAVTRGSIVLPLKDVVCKFTVSRLILKRPNTYF